MESLDGNAISGPLFEHFGAEMTMARGSCAHCQASVLIAELPVYLRGPGTVARCPSCGNVVIVLLSIGSESRVDSSAFQLLEPQASFRGTPRV